MNLNHTIKDEIRDYWSKRSETFDLSPGHEIFNDEERHGWHALFRRHLGDGEGRAVLDVASGTGVISLLLHDIGFNVTGLDFSEAMLARARAKVDKLDAPIRFVLGDAEQTLEADASYDAVVNRHLVWTLVDPEAAFAEWFRVLRPAGRLLIVDADTPTPRTRRAAFLRALARIIGTLFAARDRPGDRSRAARADRFAGLFLERRRGRSHRGASAAAGFRDIVVDRDLQDHSSWAGSQHAAAPTT